MKKKHNTAQLQNELNQSRFFTTPQTDSKTKDLGKDLDKDTDKDLTDRTKQDVRKDLQQSLNTPSNQLPTADEVEMMVFRLRKAPKVRVNGDLPEEWKLALDEYAHQAGVGKYHLVMYAVGKMLGKI